MPGVGPTPRKSWRERFNGYLKENPASSNSFKYLLQRGCPEGALVALLESAVVLDIPLPHTRQVALHPFRRTSKHIAARVNHLLEITSLIEDLDRRDIAGNRHFGSFPSILRKAAKQLNTWRPTTLIPSRYYASYVTHFVKLATHRTFYRHTANLLEAAYAVSGTDRTIDADNLRKNHFRHRKVFSNPLVENPLRSLLNLKSSPDI